MVIISKAVRFKHRLLCLAHESIFLGKPDYIHNQLKRRCILKQTRTEDTIIFESNTLFIGISNRAFSSVVPRIWNVHPYTYGSSNLILFQKETKTLSKHFLIYLCIRFI